MSTATAPSTATRSGDGPDRRRRLRPTRLAGKGLLVALALLWLAIAGGPLAFLVLTSFKGQFELLTEALWAWPQDPTLENFRLVLENDFFVFLRNSTVVVSISVVLVLLVSAMASYVFARIPFKLRTPLFALVVAGLIVPIHVTLIPIFLLTRDLGIYDSIWALIGPYVAFNVPVSVLILTGFMQAIPGELEEAARVDGAGPVRRFWSVVLPLTRPGMITVAIYNGVVLWNEFVFAFVLTTSRANRTLPLAIWDFQGQYGNNVPVVMSVLTLTALPLVIAYLLGQERITRGIMAGALKG
ncbi:carbohydrate ABC transporter permease [Egicoccus halophilus]|uniref:ABC transporter permease n=1 Tax=Egicoccus halophilus TaxID=1670830 RepID=A0A8J3EZ88_9ACTN|nr:carbohydrate ABC transporter permease [Egicoccus halophilus]GGI09437.1 ABC transporter permease [Egicoccus halophilus]